jgi:predicted RNA-binding protein associated with RNAse of E/G family
MSWHSDEFRRKVKINSEMERLDELRKALKKCLITEEEFKREWDKSD